METVAIMLIPIVAIIGIFSFFSVAAWSDARRKEREAYYHGETLKKIAEAQGPGANAALEFLRGQEKQRDEEKKTSVRRSREGTKMGGLVNIAVGVALMIFLHEIARSEPVYLAGLIPLLIGVALIVYVYFMAPKE